MKYKSIKIIFLLLALCFMAIHTKAQKLVIEQGSRGIDKYDEGNSLGHTLLIKDYKTYLDLYLKNNKVELDPKQEKQNELFFKKNSIYIFSIQTMCGFPSLNDISATQITENAIQIIYKTHHYAAGEIPCPGAVYPVQYTLVIPNKASDIWIASSDLISQLSKKWEESKGKNTADGLSEAGTFDASISNIFVRTGRQGAYYLTHDYSGKWLVNDNGLLKVLYQKGFSLKKSFEIPITYRIESITENELKLHRVANTFHNTKQLYLSETLNYKLLKQ